MYASSLTESLKVQSLPTSGVFLVIRGGEAYTRATLATKGMVHFIFGERRGETSLSSKRSERGVLFFQIKKVWFGCIYVWG